MTAANSDSHAGPGNLPFVVAGAVCLWLVATVATAGLHGVPGVLLVVLTELPVAAVIFIAAGGWGHLLVGRLAGDEAPRALTAVTSVAVGAWMLSTGVLVVGAAIGGSLTGWFWWPVVGIGAALALRAALGRGVKVPRSVHWTTALACLVLAGAGAAWTAGASLPPGMTGRATGDFYDVVSYHLQVPREFYESGAIRFLPHNTYSNYPLGVEMLFLLAMVLRGGATAGLFAAKCVHGLWGVLAVAAVWSVWTGDAAGRRGRIAGVLLATAPWAVYLGWLAFVELSELACLAIGIGWLAVWVRRGGRRAACLVGVAGGVACAMKYLSVGLVAGPLLAVMLVVAVADLLRRRRSDPARPTDDPPAADPETHGPDRPRRSLAHGIAAGLIVVAGLAPWLVRNRVNTGNPVFPLATGVFGRGHWSAESAARWDAAHAPPSWSQVPSLLAKTADGGRGLSIPLLIGTTAAILFLVVALVRRSRPSPGRTVEWIALGVLGVQAAVWLLATHMAVRFLAPALVCMAILTAGWLARLAAVRTGPRGRGGSVDAAAGLPVGGALVVGLMVAAVAVHAVSIARLWGAEPFAWSRRFNGPWGFQGRTLAELNRQVGSPESRLESLPDGARVLMVADVRPLMFPTGVTYSTVWEPGLLARLARETDDPREIIRRLRDAGITHVWVHWAEIGRLRRTYGWWEVVDEELFRRLQAAGMRPVRTLPPDAPPAFFMPDGRPVVQLFALPESAAAASGISSGGEPTSRPAASPG